MSVVTITITSQKILCTLTSDEVNDDVCRSTCQILHPAWLFHGSPITPSSRKQAHYIKVHYAWYLIYNGNEYSRLQLLTP